MSDYDVNLRINAIGNFSSVTGEVGKLQSKLQSLKLPKDLGTDAAKGLTELQQKYEKLQSLSNKGIKTKGDFNAFEKAAKEVDVALRQVEKSLNGISNKKIKLNMTDTDEIKKKVQELEQFKKAAADIANLKSFGLQSTSGIFNASVIDKIKNSFKEGTAGARNFQAVINGFKSNNIEKASTALQQFLNYAKQYEKTLNESGQNTRGTDAVKWATEAMAAIGGADAKVKELNADIKQMRADQFNKMASGADSLRSKFNEVASSIRQSGKEMRNMAASSKDMHSQLGMLQTQANYFFGLQNMFQLFKRNIQGTFDTVKQLDKAMTETAVVTDFSVSDMWSKLPLYTKTANQLGATIKGAYETMTLYYQQGLNTEEAFAVGTETMKMARIAGLDYAQTTNMMTAALRGFNMEINTTSAQRINDVYSKLAAITASDTRELGEAMERTASIAHSAGMDFGNTTAFLAQMIETTREAPENLGTAMKTIVARFQELKENPYQISEVEGEEVDFNRVDKALKTIGVDLMDNRDKFRDLDDVFMDISEKWDGLSQTQQRYIATIAAGSRQQSRFLAMVGNYDRLKQLTDAAANSEGAADVQFTKTLDSMESKINRLKNAWDQFAMGIANNKLLKGAVDFGVNLLDTVNKIENRIQNIAGGFDSLGGSIAKSITSITALWAAFKVGGKIVDTSIGLLGGFLGVTKVKGAGLFGGISGQRAAAGSAQAAAIYTPIVNAINNAAARVTNSEKTLGQQIKTSTNNANFRSSQRGLRFEQTQPVLGKNGKNKYQKVPINFTGKDAANYLSGFSEDQQRVLLKQVPGTRKALERSYKQATKNLNLKDSSAQVVNQLRTQIGQEMIKPGGAISPEAGIHLLGNPQQLAGLIDNEEVRKDILKNIGKTRADLFKEAKSKGIGKDKTGLEKANAWKAYVRNREKELYNPETKLTKEEMRANSFSGITSGATAAGQAVMNLGMALDNLGLHGAGSVLTSIGSTITSFGLAASGAVEGVTALKTALSGMGIALGPLAAVSAGIAALGIAAGIAYKKQQDHIKEIRKEGKEIATSYNDAIEQTTSNLTKLNDYRTDFAKLAQGVDINGNNVNLGSEEYSDYLKIVKEITDMHPELIKGYNAQGNIIVDNNSVIREAIKLEQKQQEEAKKTFTSQESLNKMAMARQTTKRWKVGQMSSDRTIATGRTATTIKGSSQLTNDAQKVIDNIKQLENGDQILNDLAQTYHLTAADFENLTTEALLAIESSGGDMISYIKSKAGEGSEELVDTINDDIAKVGKDFSGMREVSSDMVDSLLLYAGEKGYTDKIHSTLQGAFTNAVKDIVLFEDPENMQSAVDSVGKEFSSLGGHLEEYNDILETVEEAQTQFGKDLNLNKYNNSVKDSIKQIEQWKSAWDEGTDSTSKVLSEWAQNQIETFKNVSKGTVELADAFNVMSGRITSANSAYENWTKQNEGGDLYTASDNFKKMLEEVNDGVDELGNGSQQWWSAAQSMFGSDYVLEHSKEQIQSHMNQVKNYLKEGQEGVDNFMIDLRDNKLGRELDEDILGVKKNGAPYTIGDFIKVDKDGGLNFDKLGDAPDEAFTAIAQALGMSDDLLTSLMNKARQFGDIKFGNVDQMRAALATSDSTIVGNGFTNDNRNIYVKESDFDTQALEVLGSGDEVKEYKKDLEKLGTVFMDTASSINKGELSKYIQDWGIKTDKYQTKSGEERFQTTADAFIRYFDKAGYNKDEIQQMYETATSGKKSLITDADKVDFNEVYQTAKEKNADPSFQAVTSIEGNVSGILSVTQSIAAAMGILTGGKDGTKRQIDNETEDINKRAEELLNGTSDKSYEKARTSLEEDVASLKETKAILEQGQSNYKEGSAGWLKFQDRIDKINGSLSIAESVLNTVTKTQYESIQNQRQLQQNKTNVEDFVSQNKKLSANYKDTAIDESNNLSADKLNSLIDSVRKTTEDKNTQNNVIGQYLQNSSKTLVDQKASNQQIANSIQAAAQEMANNKMKPADIAAAINQGYGTNLTKKDVETTEEGEVKLNLDDSNLQKQLSNLQADVTANIVAINAAASGQNNPNSVFHRVGTMARGSRKGYTISGRPTLTGEEGEELVWEPRRNEAYMVGSNGPQFANISKNAVVWNAEQTKRIKKNSSFVGNIGTGARGITPVGTMAGGSGGGVSRKIPGMFDVDAMANIEDVNPPAKKPEIPVKAKLEVEGNTKGGLLNKVKGLLGKGNKGPSVQVTAEATKVTVPKDSKTSVKVTGDITRLNNKAGKLKNVKATATVNKVVKSGKVSGEPVTVKAKASVSTDTGKVEKKVNKVASAATKTQKMTIDANNGPAMTKVNQVINRIRNSKPTLTYSVSGPSSVTVPVYASFRGSWEKTVKINKGGGGAKGINNKISSTSVPQIGSMASGRHGRLGPRGKGGPTLTGEKGFEIAWLPSESRSLILGANGPQMIDLPKDAVVWTNEQSKKILKQKAIPAGSHGNPSGRYVPGGSGGSGGGGSRNSGGSSNGSRSGGSGGDGGKQAKKNQKKQTKILQKAGKINAWWWNMTKRVEATQRKIDQLNKKIEKTIDKIGTTLNSISGEVTEYIKKLKQQIGLNTEMLEKADKKLGILSGERTSKKTKDAKKAVKEDKKRLKKAKKTDSKQDDKKAKKRLKKDQKELKKSQKGVNWARISYDVIKKKGKKKTKKSKKKRINLSPYIYLDPDTGAYNVDYDKINEEIGLDHRNKKGKKVQGNKSKAKATMEAAEKRIEKYQGRHDTAEDNIDKAQDALDELGQKLYETFFAWETELTKIWNVTQKIAEAESKRGRAESFSELLDAQVADGTISSKNKLLGQDYFDKINTAFTKGINEQISSINLTKESIDLKKANLQDLLNGETERKTLENVKDIIDYSSAYGEWEDLAADTQKAINQADKKIDNAKEDKKDANKAIKKDNKIINSKKSSKKEKKEARQDRKEARQDREEAKATINAYTELKDSLSNTLTTANQEMQNILNAGYKELDAGELLAYQTEKTALEDQLKITEAANAYMRPEIKDDGTISVNFNTEDFERDKQSGLLNSTTAEKIQEYVKKIVDETQDLHDTYKDLTEKITELHSTLADLQDAWVGYSEDLMSYLEDAQEVDIEKYKSLSDSIRDALEKLLDQVKKNLEERRRQEDNAKTERDISQKQQRLAALRADTSGGHQVEIAQLEKEIADAQTDYGRNLEDQLLDRLNDQADAAAEQRERIIELEEAINSAVNNAETVNKWMENPGQFKEEIRAAVYKAKDYQNLTKAQQEQVDRQTDQLLVGLETNPKKTEEVKNAINQMTALVEFLEGSLSEVGDNVEENKDNTDSIDDKVTSVINSLRGNIDAVTQAVESVDNTLQKNETAEVERQSNAAASAQAAETTKNESAYKLAVANAKSNGTITANQFNKAISAGATLNKSADQVVQDLKTSQLTWKEILTAAHNAGWGPKKIKDLNRNASKGSAFRDAWESIFPNKKWSEYATGGLASYTGPAWLDGTPSKPELVLNPTDTKNFIALRDVLGKTMGNISNSNESLTNAMYEININVDHINSDYDVDKIAARIKKDIIKDAGYRNVTQVRNLR